MEAFLSILLLATGVSCAWVYLGRRGRSGRRLTIGGDRPWRRLGAAICLVLAVMFVLGVYVLNDTGSLRGFAAYWLVMLVLVVWLCMLAIKDILYTRRVVAGWRAGKLGLDGSPVEPSQVLDQSP